MRTQAIRDKLLKADIIPKFLRKNLVSSGERYQATYERLCGLFSRARVMETLVGEALNDGKCVLHAVVELRDH